MFEGSLQELSQGSVGEVSKPFREGSILLKGSTDDRQRGEREGRINGGEVNEVREETP